MVEGNPPVRGKPVIGPESLKAFAHPLRMELFAQLQRRGRATASQLARALGESSGQTSYHLRQLERHGFVEDDPGQSGGRQRWWRPVGFEIRESDLFTDPGTAIPAREIIQQVIAERAATLTTWLENFDPTAEIPGQLASTTLSLTDAEAEELAAELSGILARTADALRDRTPPAGSRRYRVHADVFRLAGDAR